MWKKVILLSVLFTFLTEYSIINRIPLEQTTIRLQNPKAISIVLNKEEQKDLRTKIKETSLKKTSAYLFGKELDVLEEKASSQAEECFVEKEDGKEKTCEIYFEVPENFLVKEMNLSFEVNKKEKKIQLFQEYKNEKILLLEEKLELGGMAMDYSYGKLKNFPTPSGRYFINRIVENPTWYPPKKWAKNKRPVKAGKDNPLGQWIAELFKKNTPGDYNFPSENDSYIRIHSSKNLDNLFGTQNSHGCIRLKRDVVNELFPAILHYTPHKEPQTNPRGKIYPLEKVIEVDVE